MREWMGGFVVQASERHDERFLARIHGFLGPPHVVCGVIDTEDFVNVYPIELDDYLSAFFGSEPAIVRGFVLIDQVFE